MSQVILSGIRATGRLHFGNFLGAVQNFVKFQEQIDATCMYFVADWHTLTTLKDPEVLRSNLIEMIKDYIAAGLDPNKSIIYTQSSIPEIAELALYLSMFQPINELNLIPTYKELVRKNPDQVSLGLLSYPILMAADILGPRATMIPVGEDQIPNVELARSLAQRFNRRFGEIFVIPEMMEQMIKVPGLDGNKMGKSDNNSIEIGAPMNIIGKLYMKKGITDPERKHLMDLGDPYNRCKSVYGIHELITQDEKDLRVIANKCMKAEISCVECKKILVESIAKILIPFQEKRKELTDKDDYVSEILYEGGKRARSIIAKTVAVVRDKMGIVLYS